MSAWIYALLVGGLAYARSENCSPAIVAGFATQSNCFWKTLKSRPLRVAYLDKQFVTTNAAAAKQVASLQQSYVYGSTCESAKTAVPECFQAANWNGGWMGKFMWGVFTNYMNMGNSDIVAMTTLNFTGATDPKNATSVYKGSSSFTRCVWEVNLGNIDVCVGDFWETQERRTISTFTTAIAVDQFVLVTRTIDDNSAVTLKFPSAFNPATMQIVFRPLAWPVWWVLGSTLFFGGCAFFFMEGTQKYLVKGRLRSDFRFDEPEFEWSWDYFVTCVWAAIVHFLWNSPQFSPRTPGGMISLLGLCALVVIITASYTASLTAFLASPVLQAKEVESFRSLEVLVQNFKSNPLDFDKVTKGKLCTLQSAQGLFASVLSPNQIIGMDNYGPMFEQLFNGECGCVVSGRNEYLIYVQASAATFSVCANASDPKGYASCQPGFGPSRIVALDKCQCVSNPSTNPDSCPGECPDYQKYADFVLADQDGFDQWYNWALPVRPDLSEVLSTSILQSRLAGDLDQARHDELVDKVNFQATDDSQITTIFDAYSMMGVYIYMSIMLGIGLLLHILKPFAMVGFNPIDFHGKCEDIVLNLGEAAIELDNFMCKLQKQRENEREIISAKVRKEKENAREEGPGAPKLEVDENSERFHKEVLVNVLLKRLSELEDQLNSERPAFVYYDLPPDPADVAKAAEEKALSVKTKRGDKADRPPAVAQVAQPKAPPQAATCADLAGSEAVGGAEAAVAEPRRAQGDDTAAAAQPSGAEVSAAFHPVAPPKPDSGRGGEQ